MRGYGRNKNKNFKKWEENSAVEVRTPGEPASCRVVLRMRGVGEPLSQPSSAARELGVPWGEMGCPEQLLPELSFTQFSPPPLEGQGSGGRLRGHQQGVGELAWTFSFVALGAVVWFVSDHQEEHREASMEP